jgi:glyoxylase-like metal-dependent hydrolase (beta-lactamase superfamily II)
MASVKRFVFNPFQENTYILYDHTRECVIIDPGMYDRSEEHALKDFIEREQLVPVKLLNTHCHIDHIMGNRFVKETYQIPFYIHRLETENLERAPLYGSMFGVRISQQPAPDFFLNHNEELTFGNTTLRVLFTPGHSAGGVCFYCASDSFIISGDVLFQRSIGRTDLPGGDYHTLIRSIKTHLLPLNDDVVVFSGHGPETTIGEERMENPFLN